MRPLIRRAFWLWFGHQQDSIERGAQASNGVDIADQVPHQDLIEQNPSRLGIGGNLSAGAQRNFSNPVDEPVKSRVFEVNEGSISV